MSEHISAAQAPITEPERQYYYIELAKKYVKNLSDQLGRTPTFCVTTFGCPTV